MNDTLAGGNRRWLLATLLVACGSCASPFMSKHAAESGVWSPGTALHSIEVGGEPRSFLLHVPPAQPRNRLRITQPYPLILVLHGSGADGESVRHASRMDSIADVSGALVAYPNATKGPLGLFGADWNAGSCCGAASREKVNDVAFILGVIDKVSAQFPMDAHRVYIAGFSDGGRMAYRMACEASPRIAAVAIVAGSLRKGGCEPAVTVPLIAFHATADDQVPYGEASDTPPPHSPLPGSDSLPPSIQAWSATNNCSALASRKVSAHGTRYDYTRCNGGADVTILSIAGGRHGWPGEPDAPAPMSELSASDAMIRFFLRHTR